MPTSRFVQMKDGQERMRASPPRESSHALGDQLMCALLRRAVSLITLPRHHSTLDRRSGVMPR